MWFYCTNMVDIKINEVDLKKAIQKVDALGNAISSRQRKAMLRKAAKVIRDEARKNIPIADRPTVIYSTPKIDGKKRAPKGQGRIKYKFEPGTLKADINIKSLRRSKDVFVGPGTRNKVTAFWAHWLEFGNSQLKGIGYMRRAVVSKKGEAIKILIAESKKLIDRTIKKIKE